MKKTTALLPGILSICVLALTAQAQDLNLQQTRINSTPNPIGSGARALGMGGAFIAVADDATAASWNPGGLMQLERPEFSFVFSFSHNRKEINNSFDRSMRGMNSISREDLNYFSVAVPFRAFNKNMIISLNYQRLYDLYDDMSFDIQTSSLDNKRNFSVENRHVDFKQSGSLKAFSPAYAIQLTPRLSVGATFNFWTDNLGYDNEWESDQLEYSKSAISNPGLAGVIQDKLRIATHVKNTNFEAFNMNLGFLWRINSVVTLGGVFKTPYTASFRRRTRQDVSYISNVGDPFTSTNKTRERVEMHFPTSYGLGVAFRLSDVFTTSFDVYRTEWSDFWIRSRGRKSSPITNKTRRESHMHNTTQVRAGCEYLIVLERTIIPIRAGVFYDPEPSEKHPDDFYGFSLGTGLSLGPVVIDCAYMFRWGRNVRGSMVDKQGTTFDVRQHNFYVSMIYHF